MSLKTDVVVVSRFSLNMGANKGTRGGTPGNYIMRYMTRDHAVENVAPTEVADADGTLLRYDKRKECADSADSPQAMRSGFRKTQKKGGLAFCNGNPSMSDAAVRRDSKEVQKKFNEGHTAIETVISFTDDYLRRNGILEEGFVHEKRGDYEGHIDQMKLRLAVMDGMKRLAPSFDDLHYTGVIQTNTDHVHCHLLMMDYGEGSKGPDGKQRGKLTDNQMRTIRRGIDTYLDEKQSVRMKASSVEHDKRNALCYIKRMTHETLAQQGMPQFLMACLPKNRNLWSANSNRREMRKPNAIVRDFVVSSLQPHGRPTREYRDAHNRIVEYADQRQEREGLTEDERLKLIRNGDEGLIRSCMNGVYSVLKRIPQDELEVRTPMMEAMSMDYESMAAEAVNDPSLEFGLRLRSYSSRLNTHRKDYHKYRDELEDAENTPDRDPASDALIEYLQLEATYQQMLMVKYQYFLTFLPPDEDIGDEFDAVMRQSDRLEKMEAMTDDPAFMQMGPETADQYGRRTYGIGRGNLIKSMPDVWGRMVDQEREKTQKTIAAFRDRLHDYGLDFDGRGVNRKKMYEFDDVKALDLHHLGYDFPYDAQVSKKNVDAFVEMADRRYEAFLKAEDYLERTGQAASVEDLPKTDVENMKRFADRMSFREAVSGSELTIQSQRPANMRAHDGSTIRLGRDYSIELHEAVQAAVDSAYRYEEES